MELAEYNLATTDLKHNSERILTSMDDAVSCESNQCGRLRKIKATTVKLAV